MSTPRAPSAAFAELENIMSFDPWNFKAYGRDDWIGLALLIAGNAIAGAAVFLLLVAHHV